MKPKEVFETCAQKYLIPEFEKLGFKYSSNQKSFSRKINVFKQTITFSFSKYNGADLIDFWSMWGVSSCKYE